MARIFISYRRDDSAGYVLFLSRLLRARFGEDVFTDIHDIEPGTDFVKVIEDQIGRCDAVVALIGPRWLLAADEQGQRRLDDPEDYLRLELATALARDIRVIPALVHGARMPRSTVLPDDLAMLPRRQAITLNDDTFDADVARLIDVLAHALEAIAAQEQKGTPASSADRAPSPSYTPAVEGAAPPRDKHASADPSRAASPERPHTFDGMQFARAPGPAILIGVGGIGTEIVLMVRRRVLAAVRDPTGLQADEGLVDTRFLFFGLDTWDSGAVNELRDLRNFDVLDMPDLGHIANTLWQKDDFFREWWPENKVPRSDLVRGAGQVRINGKLAYYLCLTGGAGSGALTAGDRLKSAAASASFINRAEDPSARTTVYLVSSLVGGTGSGSFLTIAYHLRQLLKAEHTPLIGVFLLPGIIEKAVDRSAWTHILANGHAALKELNWWMNQDPDSRERIRPFLKLPDGTVYTGDQPPFDFCYLFGHEDAAGQQLATFSDYLGMVADCLSTELFLPVSTGPGFSAESFHTALRTLEPYLVSGSHSRAYGSAGVSSLVYPVELIIRSLALAYAAQILDGFFLSPADIVPYARSASEDFLRDHGLGGDHIFLQLRDRLAASVEGPMAAEPRVDAVLKEATAATLRSDIERLMSQADLWLEHQHELATAHIDGDTQGTLTGLRVEINEALAARLDELLRRTEGNGFEVAYEFIKDLEALVTEASRQMELHLNGDARSGRRGLRAELLSMTSAGGDAPPPPESLEGYIRAMHREAERRFRGNFGRMKREFGEQWFRKYLRVSADAACAEVARAYLGDLRQTIGELRAHAAAITNVLANLVRSFEDRSRQELADRRASTSSTDGIVDYVLAEPRLIRRKFLSDEPLDRVIARAMLVTSGRGLVEQWRGLRQLGAGRTSPMQQARRLQEIRDSLESLIIELACNHFRPRVSALSVWDALYEQATDDSASDDEAALEVIAHRLRRARKNLVPFWAPDQTALSIHPNLLSAQLTERLLACNVSAFKQFAARHERASALIHSLTGAERDAETLVDIPNRHQVWFYIRQGGLPLAVVNPRDLQAMRAAEKTHSQAVRTTLYTDKRYEDLPLPEIVLPEEHDPSAGI